MELVSGKFDRKSKRKVHFLRVTEREAHQIIKSLGAQLVSRDPNSEREEFTLENGDDFTIAVHPDVAAERARLDRFAAKIIEPLVELEFGLHGPKALLGAALKAKTLRLVIDRLRERVEELLPVDYLAEERKAPRKMRKRKVAR